MAEVEWDRVFEILYGHPPDKPEPVYLKVLQGLSRDVADAFEKRAKEIIREVVTISKEKGLSAYLQYVFFVLMEDSKSWPDMPDHRKKKLRLICSVLSRSGDTPTYTDGLTTPPSDLEARVDETLLALAEWGYHFGRSLRQEFKEIVRKSQPKIARKLRGIDSALIIGMFEMSVAKYPLAYPKGHFLAEVFSII